MLVETDFWLVKFKKLCRPVSCWVWASTCPWWVGGGGRRVTCGCHGGGHEHDEHRGGSDGAVRSGRLVAGRHKWVDQSAGRIAGDAEDWLDELAGAVADGMEHAQAWRDYEQRHREPLDEGAYVAWLDAGPSNTARGAAFATMSGGEQRMVRLVATLCPRTRVPWSVGDIGFDERGAAVLDDWLRIVHGQLPDWLYAG